MLNELLADRIHILHIKNCNQNHFENLSKIFLFFLRNINFIYIHFSYHIILSHCSTNINIRYKHVKQNFTYLVNERIKKKCPFAPLTDTREHVGTTALPLLIEI